MGYYSKHRGQKCLFSLCEVTRSQCFVCTVWSRCLLIRPICGFCMQDCVNSGSHSEIIVSTWMMLSVSLMQQNILRFPVYLTPLDVLQLKFQDIFEVLESLNISFHWRWTSSTRAQFRAMIQDKIQQGELARWLDSSWTVAPLATQSCQVAGGCFRTFRTSPVSTTNNVVLLAASSWEGAN